MSPTKTPQLGRGLGLHLAIAYSVVVGLITAEQICPAVIMGLATYPVTATNPDHHFSVLVGRLYPNVLD